MKKQTIMLALRQLESKKVKTNVDIAAIQGLQYALTNYQIFID